MIKVDSIRGLVGGSEGNDPEDVPVRGEDLALQARLIEIHSFNTYVYPLYSSILPDVPLYSLFDVLSWTSWLSFNSDLIPDIFQNSCNESNNHGTGELARSSFPLVFQLVILWKQGRYKPRYKPNSDQCISSLASSYQQKGYNHWPAKAITNKLKYKWTVMWIRIRSDPDSFGSVDPDPDPDPEL